MIDELERILKLAKKYKTSAEDMKIFAESTVLLSGVKEQTVHEDENVPGPQPFFDDKIDWVEWETSSIYAWEGNDPKVTTYLAWLGINRKDRFTLIENFNELRKFKTPEDFFKNKRLLEQDNEHTLFTFVHPVNGKTYTAALCVTDSSYDLTLRSKISHYKKTNKKSTYFGPTIDPGAEGNHSRPGSDADWEEPISEG